MVAFVQVMRDFYISSKDIQIGTLRSFYSCRSLGDTSPVLVASGSSDSSEIVTSMKKCIKWAFNNAFTTITSSSIHIDSSSSSGNANIYASLTGTSGSCFVIAGGLITQPKLIEDSTGKEAYIPALQVTCNNQACVTIPTALTVGATAYGFVIPYIAVTCTTGVNCATAAKTVVCSHGGGGSCTATLSIPALPLTIINPTAGSLLDYCMHALDY